MKKNAIPKPYGAWIAEASDGLTPDGALFPASARHQDRRRAEAPTEEQKKMASSGNNKISRKILK